MSKVKSIAYYILLTVVFVLIGWFANTAYKLYTAKDTSEVSIVKLTPLAKYSIKNLSKAEIKPSEIVIGKVLKDNPRFTSHEFTMKFSPDLSENLKTTSGLINIPQGSEPCKKTGCPIVIMIRGYVDPKNYSTGIGTQHAAEFFAQNGFITIAPDFLGYGNSDKESSDVFEARFQTYVTAITLLKTISTSEDSPRKLGSNSINIDTKNIFIWGHSNGGQIALTTLEATGETYPTVLWAPVSKPFPYSILYYTDDASDSGKFLRSKTAEFENNYDSDLFSLTKYLNLIKAPIQLNQGTMDDAVPVVWSDLLAKNLKKLDIDVTYIKYPGADHNLNPTWSKTIQNALTFYQEHLK